MLQIMLKLVRDRSKITGEENKCNEVLDCHDMRDELGCNYENKAEELRNKATVGCYPGDFNCSAITCSVAGDGADPVCSYPRCVRQSRVGDYSKDCTNYADEIDSDYSRYSSYYIPVSNYSVGMEFSLWQLAVVLVYRLAAY